MKLYYYVLVIFLIICITGCLISQSHLQRGKYYFNKKNYNRAIRELQKAANEKGNIYYYIDAYSYLGDAYAETGQIMKAISTYRSALQMIHLRMREISARRFELRRELNFTSHIQIQKLQNEDMQLSDEQRNWKETGKNLKRKIEDLLDNL